MPETPENEINFASRLSYEQCISAIYMLTGRIEALTDALTEVTPEEWAARLATINNLDSVLLIHGIHRDAEAEASAEEDTQ